MTEIQINQLISCIIMLISIVCNVSAIIMACDKTVSMVQETKKHRFIRFFLMSCGVSLCIIALIIGYVVEVK